VAWGRRYHHDHEAKGEREKRGRKKGTNEFASPLRTEATTLTRELPNISTHTTDITHGTDDGILFFPLLPPRRWGLRR
jgi:hypothetical protein